MLLWCMHITPNDQFRETRALIILFCQEHPRSSLIVTLLYHQTTGPISSTWQHACSPSSPPSFPASVATNLLHETHSQLPQEGSVGFIPVPFTLLRMAGFHSF